MAGAEGHTLLRGQKGGGREAGDGPGAGAGLEHRSPDARRSSGCRGDGEPQEGGGSAIPVAMARGGPNLQPFLCPPSPVTGSSRGPRLRTVTVSEDG